MTQPLSGLRVRTLTINSGDVPPLTGSGPYPPPVNQTLSRHDVIWQPTVTINSDDSCRGGLKLCTVTKNGDDIYLRACLTKTPPLKHVRARTPPPVNKTLSRHDVIWQRIVTIYSDDSCRVWLKTMYCCYK